MVTKFAVLGSCACRDIFYSKINKNYKDFFQIEDDGIRISLISLMSNKNNYDSKSLDIYPKNRENNNYSNWIKKDFNKSFLDSLKEKDIEYLMIDTYYDVNFGVVDLGDGKFITNNLKLDQTAFFKNLEDYEILTIFNNFEKYFKIWINACDLFFNFLKNNCPSIKVILNTNRHVFKVLKSNGSIVESNTFQEHCDKFNKYRDILDEYILRNYDVDVLFFDENIFADENHIWGNYSLHYEPFYYQDMTNQLNEIIKRDKSGIKFDYDYNKIIRQYKRDKILLKFRINKMQHKFNVDFEELNSILDEKEKIINNLPQLSNTYIGATTLNGKITYRNWWRARMPEFEGFLEAQWFTQFLEYHFPDADYKINMFSVFGNEFRFDAVMDGKKVFYGHENANPSLHYINKQYGRYALDYVDFAMGHDLWDNPKYLRLPYWITYMFRPYYTEEHIINTYEYIRSVNFPKTDDVVLVASHDIWGTRTKLTKTIENWVDITYAGSWRNNTSELWEKYNDDKMDLLKKFRFNICVENIVEDAYVTEKIFDAARSDCIPIYAGGGDYLEPEVINKNAVLLWDLSGCDKNELIDDNRDTLELFRNLREDEKSYLEFKDQDLLYDDGYKFIIKTFSDLEKHFERIIFD